MAAVREWLAAAEADLSDESVWELLSIVPPDVIEQAVSKADPVRIA